MSDLAVFPLQAVDKQTIDPATVLQAIIHNFALIMLHSKGDRRCRNSELLMGNEADQAIGRSWSIFYPRTAFQITFGVPQRLALEEK